jgi:hypothetical protein
MRRIQGQSGRVLLACLMICVLPLSAADNAIEGTAASVAAGKPTAEQTSSEIELLKKLLANQQRQIDELRQALAQQAGAKKSESESAASNQSSAEPAAAQTAAASASLYPNLGQVASSTPVLPRSSNLPAAFSRAALPQVATGAAKPAVESSPLQFKIGDAYITPVGFMDLTSVTRNVTTGSSLGTNFGSIPYGNTAAANLSESRLTTQNSRIGLRVDALVKGAKVLGYLESDFLGFVPTNAAVTSNSDSLRMRLYWVDVRKGKLEFLGGQSWSMLTPSRKGIGALPSDLFYSQVIDTNYMNGLTWSRQSGFRVLVHPNSKVTFGAALENAEQYVGGSGGGGKPVLPAALTSLAGTQFNDGTTTLNAPQLHPDIIAKLAFDPNSKFHFEVAGIERTFKDYIASSNTTFTKAGAGVQVNMNVEIAKGFRFVANNYYSDGGGRYLFGVAPDVILRSDGSISPIHAHSTVDGFEFTRGNTFLYAYYGGIYIGRNTALDANGTTNIGYGFSTCSPSTTCQSQNRTTNEATFGINQTFWRDGKYGALNLMFQYAYLQRNPWVVATGTPTSASANMAWVNLRYTLPGSAPTLGR